MSNSPRDTVTVAGVANPTADFDLSPATPGVNQQVFFDANASQAAPGRTITRYDWNFGDGGFGSGVTESHRFPRAGDFTVTLTVTDSAGETGTASKTVTVGDTHRADGGVHRLAGARCWSTSWRSSTAPCRRRRRAGRITRYEWNFGDNHDRRGPARRARVPRAPAPTP